MPRPALRDEKRDQEAAVETTALFEALTARLPADDHELDDEQRTRRLLAHLLEFHRREDRWEFYPPVRLHRGGARREPGHARGADLRRRGGTGESASVIHRYRFPEQPHEISGSETRRRNPDTAESDELKRGFCGTVVALD